VADRLFSDQRLAKLYDSFCDCREDFGFYLPRAMAARAVLDVGCGTGALLHRAREEGHAGRLCGLDPAEAMLRQARRRADIEWRLGDLRSVAFDREFDLVIMTGHAFQVLVDDDDLRLSLAAIRSALANDGRFVFETRNPHVREWQDWIPENAVEIVDANGAVVRMAHSVESVSDEEIVSFNTTFTSSAWTRPEVSHSRLRFLNAVSLLSFLHNARLEVEEQFGDWDGEPLADTSPEIITIARCV
jgi:SAM-dependent methyltransferase